MYLEIKGINKKNVLEAEKFFGNIFCKKLKKEKIGTYKESLMARFLINKNMPSPPAPLLGRRGELYNSISHKKDLVFIGVNNNKIGVDIEILKIRDKNLLNNFLEKEYEILGGKNWKNFYILWTAKESIIKLENLTLNDIKEIILIEKTEINQKINAIDFNKKLFLKYKNKNFFIFSGYMENIFYSVTNT